MTPGVLSARGLPPGTRMGRYELIHRLAMGGMAELYVARHSGIQGFERTVVVKRVLPNLTEDPEFISMFLDEARIAASLDHPNIAQVTDIDQEDGEYFFAMEYVHGKNLREVLAPAPQGLPLGMALAVVTGIAAGLHHAHEALGSDGRPLGLVHRDVSPSNVMIAFSGAVKLTDFGIAKASARTSKTLAGRIKGKVGYMSPEQCRAEEVDRRSDIFSLGIVAYETLTGARAFYAPNEFAAMARIARADYIPPTELDPEFPPELERIIARALQKDARHRYATAEEMQLDLEAFAEASGHTLSTIELAAHMREVFGTPPHPQTLAVPRPVVTESPTVHALPPARSTERRAWVSPAVAGASVVFGGIALAFALTREAPAPTPAAEASSTAPDVGPATGEAERAAPVLDVIAVDAEPSPAADTTGGATEPPTRAAAENDDDASAKPSAPKKKKPRAAKKAKPPRAGRSPYPPGYER